MALTPSGFSLTFQKAALNPESVSCLLIMKFFSPSPAVNFFQYWTNV